MRALGLQLVVAGRLSGGVVASDLLNDLAYNDDARYQHPSCVPTGSRTADDGTNQHGECVPKGDTQVRGPSEIGKCRSR